MIELGLIHQFEAGPDKMISVEEKGWLLAGGSYDVYKNRLDQLAEKYGIAPTEVLLTK